MIKKFMMLAAGLLAGNAAALTSVWNAGVDGALPLAKWYTYTGATTDKITLTQSTEKYNVLSTTVSTTNDASVAGVSIDWASKTDVDLSAYKGLCLTYKSLKPFKLDFKQSDFAKTNYNYFGYVVPAQSTVGALFIPFEDLAQEEYWGEKMNLDLTKQTGLQFSYKQSLAKAASSATNTITIAAIAVGNSCSNADPVLGAGYTDGESMELIEGAEPLEFDLSKMFADADGDLLTVTVAVPDSEVVVVDAKKSYTGEDVVKLTTKSNPTDKAVKKVVFTAKDPSGASVTYTVNFTLVDRDNPPVAKDVEYTVLEDSSYKSGLKELNNLCYDADGDTPAFNLVDEPVNGTLTITEKTGQIVYVPNKDFFGKDYFTYKCSSKDDSSVISDLGTATITVKNVNDVPVVKILSKTFLDEDGEEHKFGDTLKVDEDFGSFGVLLSKSNISIVDPDGESDYKVSAKASGIVTVALTADDEDYLFAVTSIKDANGVAKVSFVVTDPAGAITNDVFYVKVNPVADPPIAKDDSYEVVQDSLNTITAKKGVLANDVNPDGKASSLKAVLVEGGEPASGKLTLKEDGSFTYDAEPGFEGTVEFGYFAVNEDGVESDLAVVTLNVVHKNQAPVVLAGVADTASKRISALTEDFSTVINYTMAEVKSWFEDPEGDAFTVTMVSKDSLLKVSSSTSKFALTSVRNAFGKAVLQVIAKDAKGATSVLELEANLAPVNDAPVSLARDTIYVTDSGWVETVDLSKLFTDPDGDEMIYSVKSVAKGLDATIKDGVLTIAPNGQSTLYKNKAVYVVVNAFDQDSLSAVNSICVINGEKPSSIKALVAAPKATWQSAVAADRGTAVMMDVQGRVMWKSALPVSESEVRAAAASVQGRKILRVNSQTYTIK